MPAQLYIPTVHVGLRNGIHVYVVKILDPVSDAIIMPEQIYGLNDLRDLMECLLNIRPARYPQQIRLWVEDLVYMARPYVQSDTHIIGTEDVNVDGMIETPNLAILRHEEEDEYRLYTRIAGEVWASCSGYETLHNAFHDLLSALPEKLFTRDTVLRLHLDLMDYI